jgi:hypothetical protein
MPQIGVPLTFYFLFCKALSAGYKTCNAGIFTARRSDSARMGNSTNEELLGIKQYASHLSQLDPASKEINTPYEYSRSNCYHDGIMPQYR